MIAIVDYGVGNLRSVEKAFQFIGADARITRDRQAIQAASHVVLPGVGAFAAGMAGLKDSGLYEPVLEQAAAGKPLLGICLGMQMLFESSLEGGENAGMGLLKGQIVPFPPEDKVPHMGWNSLSVTDHPLFRGIRDGAYVYFVHSYYASAVPEEHLAGCEYIVPFTAAAGKDNVCGVQFHPEKSGEVGLKMLKNFAAF